jgi:hypothetical protein
MCRDRLGMRDVTAINSAGGNGLRFVRRRRAVRAIAGRLPPDFGELAPRRQ